MIIKISHSAKAAAEELYGPFENIFLKQKLKIIFTIIIFNKYIHLKIKCYIFCTNDIYSIVYILSFSSPVPSSPIQCSSHWKGSFDSIWLPWNELRITCTLERRNKSWLHVIEERQRYERILLHIFSQCLPIIQNDLYYR